MDPDDDGGFVPIEECADRLGLSVAQVLDLVQHRVLRAVDYGMGLIYVQPAIISH
ncbi:hypothetical protein ACAG24_009765 [Mycobacterium sp. pW049]|uniref:hypothetical protein n=1 Tax=[Mycobacterium] bulgaricum TaxID=3238985 RepID=UPI00351B1A24